MDIEDRNKLVEDNIKLVPYVVSKYFSKYGDTEEFISEGYIGLIRAANAYNKNSKYSFSTLAYRCIHNEICRYLTVQNYDCRKANLNTVYIHHKMKHDTESEFIDFISIDEDYSTANASYLLELIDSFNLKDAKFIVIKRSEGYSWRQIGAMLGISGENVRYKVLRIKDRLIKLGISA